MYVKSSVDPSKSGHACACADGGTHNSIDNPDPDKNSCYDTDAAADCSATKSDTCICSLDLAENVRKVVGGSAATVSYDGETDGKKEWSPLQNPVRIEYGASSGESELCTPLPNSLPGVRVERGGSGEKPEPLLDKSPLDKSSLSVTGVRARNGPKLTLLDLRSGSGTNEVSVLPGRDTYMLSNKTSDKVSYTSPHGNGEKTKHLHCGHVPNPVGTTLDTKWWHETRENLLDQCEHHEQPTEIAERLLRYGKCPKKEISVAMAGGPNTVEARESVAKNLSDPPQNSISDYQNVATVKDTPKETCECSGPSRSAGSEHSMSVRCVGMSLGGESQCTCSVMQTGLLSTGASHTSDELSTGPYQCDNIKSTEIPKKSCDSGNMSTAAEYDEEITSLLDHTADTGLGVGTYGGNAAVRGMFEETTKKKGMVIGDPSLGWWCTVTFEIRCDRGGWHPEAHGVVEYNPKYTDAKTLSGAPIRTIGALGLGKSLSTNGTASLVSLREPNGLHVSLGKHDCPEGTWHSDKATSTDQLFTGCMLCLNLVIHIGPPIDTCVSPVLIQDVQTCGPKQDCPLPNSKGGCREVRQGDGMSKTETYPPLDAHAIRDIRYGKCHNCEMPEAKHKGKSTLDASETMADEGREPPVNSFKSHCCPKIPQDAGSGHTKTGQLLIMSLGGEVQCAKSVVESLKTGIGKITHTSDELIIGSYIVDAEKSTEASTCPADVGNSAAATEYNSDTTKIVDHSTDSGLEGGDGGGSAAAIGMLEEAVEREKLHIGQHPKKTSLGEPHIEVSEKNDVVAQLENWIELEKMKKMAKKAVVNVKKALKVKKELDKLEKQLNGGARVSSILLPPR